MRLVLVTGLQLGKSDIHVTSCDGSGRTLDNAAVPDRNRGQAPPATTDTWAISRDADFRRAGTNLAANTPAMLQIEGIRDTAVQTPFPGARGSWACLDGMGLSRTGPGSGSPT